MREIAQTYRNWWAEQEWLFKEIWPHLPKDAKRKILQEYEVNKLDPDFSFYRAAFDAEPEPLLDWPAPNR